MSKNAFKIFRLIRGEYADYQEYKSEQTQKKKNIKASSKKKEKSFWGCLYKWTNEHYVITAFLASIIVASLFIGVMLIYSHTTRCCLIDNIDTDKERIVLTFVGILATFIVLTNHAQTAEATRRVEQQLKDNEILINKIDSQMSQQQQTITDKTSKLAHDAFMRNISLVNACQEKETLECARKIVAKYMEKSDSKFNIEYVSRKPQNEDLILSRRETRIFFRDTTDQYGISISSKDIKKIDGMEYNHDHIETIVFNLMLLKENSNV